MQRVWCEGNMFFVRIGFLIACSLPDVIAGPRNLSISFLGGERFVVENDASGSNSHVHTLIIHPCLTHIPFSSNLESKSLTARWNSPFFLNPHPTNAAFSPGQYFPSLPSKCASNTAPTPACTLSTACPTASSNSPTVPALPAHIFPPLAASAMPA